MSVLFPLSTAGQIHVMRPRASIYPQKVDDVIDSDGAFRQGQWEHVATLTAVKVGFGSLISTPMSRQARQSIRVDGYGSVFMEVIVGAASALVLLALEAREAIYCPEAIIAGWSVAQADQRHSRIDESVAAATASVQVERVQIDVGSYQVLS